MSPPRSPYTQGCLTILRAIHPTEALTAPPETLATVALTVPYYLLFPIHTSNVSGPLLGDPGAFVDFHYDVRAVGTTHEQAELAMDDALDALVGRNPDRTYQVAWPTSPEPADRRLEGWTDADQNKERTLAWVQAEIVVAVLT